MHKSQQSTTMDSALQKGWVFYALQGSVAVFHYMTFNSHSCTLQLSHYDLFGGHVQSS